MYSQPFRALVAVVDQLAVAAERMAEQKDGAGREEEHRESAPAEEPDPADDCGARHAGEP